MKHILSFAAFLAVVVLAACSNGQPGSRQGAHSLEADTMTISYAKGFTVRTLDGGIHLVDVADPQEDEDKMPASYHFALVPKQMSSEELSAISIPEGYTKVRTPIERTIVMTMLQLSNFTALDAHNVVKGITGTKNLFNEDIRRRVKDGSIVKIGMEGNFDAELILAANPEAIFISPFKRGGYDVIKETGILLIPHLGYKELDPLGQAEWMKYVGLFIGKEHEADSIFAAIEQRYVAMKEKTAAAATRPTVFSGEMHGGNWYAVGGKNYLAQLFRDAGADYVVKDDNTGGVNIEFEQMYATAANADYWRILNSYDGDFSYEALQASEPRNALFKAFKERKVIYCNMKTTPFYEKTPVMPDVVLSDLTAIFHPELMPADYQPTFYHLLPATKPEAAKE
ncbi:MAG: ABC transporter substrate-binding protein [Prevotella sp.]|nr:ABC transporter substrate-binding protein [Prevotella sp.]